MLPWEWFSIYKSQYDFCLEAQYSGDISRANGFWWTKNFLSLIKLKQKKHNHLCHQISIIRFTIFFSQYIAIWLRKYYYILHKLGLSLRWVDSKNSWKYTLSWIEGLSLPSLVCHHKKMRKFLKWHRMMLHFKNSIKIDVVSRMTFNECYPSKKTPLLSADG
jgi:hypothetical protein